MDKPQVDVRTMERGDLSAVADVHMTVFPDYFLTHMGSGFLERYYGSYVGVPGAYALVAADGQSIVGFIVGARNEGQLTKGFYRSQWPVLGATIAWRFVSRPVARANIWSRTGVMRQAISVVFSPKSRTASRPTAAKVAGAPTGEKASLMSIGVDPAYRGQGIAEKLQAEFAACARRDGATWLRLNVRPDNARAVGFYAKSGWRVLRSTAEKTTYFLEL